MDFFFFFFYGDEELVILALVAERRRATVEVGDTRRVSPSCRSQSVLSDATRAFVSVQRL